MGHRHIICDDLSFRYEGEQQVLKNVSFQLGHEDAVGLIGANGAGKSTLLRILTGLELNFSGEVLIDGVRVTKKTLPRIRERLGFAFQDSENQLFMPTLYEDIAFAPRNYGMEAEEIAEKVDSVLKLVGIEHLKHKPGYRMSGGEKRMAAIAVILGMSPDVILLDEPTIALDPKNRRRVIEILNQLPQIKLIVSHDLDMVLETCSRVILLRDGHIVKDAPTREILEDRELLETNGLELPLCMQGDRGIVRAIKSPQEHIHI